MQSLYQKEAYEEVLQRMNRLHQYSQAKWGKMNVGQMLAHCKEAFKVPLSEKPMKRMLLGYILGPVARKQLYNDTPYKHSLPTAPNFIIKDHRNFEAEKNELLKLVHQFYELGPAKTGLYPHPFFGTLTKEQWGMGMYKHLDHHLKQFDA